MADKRKPLEPMGRLYYEAMTGGGYSQYPQYTHGVGAVIPSCHKVINLYSADQILWAATLAFNQPPPEGLEMEQVSLWVDGADAALDALLRELGMEEKPQ